MLYFPSDKCNSIRVGTEKGDIVTVKDTWTITAVEFPAVYLDELTKINIVIEKKNDVFKGED